MALAPDPVAALARLRDLRTWYTALGGGAFLRVDATGPYFTFDFHELRFHYDGNDLWMQKVRPLGDASDPGPTPTLLPASVAGPFRDAWDEARAGFPNTTFTLESPSSVRPSWQPDPFHADVWFRVHFPFAWAAEVAVFVGLRPGPGVYRAMGLSLLDPATGEPMISLSARRGSDRLPDRFSSTLMPLNLRADSSADPATLIDVPLGPDAYSPTYAVPREVHYVAELGDGSGRLPYHDAVRRVELAYDHSGSTGHTSAGTPVEALIVGPTTCTPNATVRSQGTLYWKVPQDEATLGRVATATTSCRSVTFEMSSRVSLALGPGARGCVTGAWQLVDRSATPPTVVLERNVDECRVGPDRVARPQTVSIDLAPSTDAGNLAVRFVGEAVLTCPATPDATRHEVAFDARAPLPPVLHWGCWPGWNP